MRFLQRPHLAPHIGLLILSSLISGCGTTMSNTVTEQLLTSDAVDRSIADVDFRDLAGQKIFFDTQFVQPVKGIGFVNSEYIISSLRQQMMAADCLLQEKIDDADYVVEARVGALGSEKHEVIYGMPANNVLSAAASVVPTVPTVPTIPEISLAKRDNQLGAAKLGLFAYHRETREPVWQSGITQAKSTSNSMWVLGIGPFQRGTIHEGTQFAGSKLKVPLLGGHDDRGFNPPVNYQHEHHFELAKKLQKSNAAIAKAQAQAAEKARVIASDAAKPSNVEQAGSAPDSVEPAQVKQVAAEPAVVEPKSAEPAGVEPPSVEPVIVPASGEVPVKTPPPTPVE